MEPLNRIATALRVTIALGVAFSICPAVGAEPIIRKPATPWKVDWSPEICSLQRGFVGPKRTSLLMIDRLGSTDEFQLTIIDDKLAGLTGGARVALRFGNAEPMTPPRTLMMKTPQGQTALVIDAVSLGGLPKRVGNALVWPKTSSAQAAQMMSLTMIVNERELTFDTGPLDKAFSALSKCTDDLVQSWGLDAAQQSSLSRPLGPANYPGIWITDADYPAGLRRRRAEATVSFRLLVDEEGKPTSCHVLQTRGDPELNEPTCALLMRRAKFKPALDNVGTPIASYYVNRIVWVVPG